MKTIRKTIKIIGIIFAVLIVIIAILAVYNQIAMNLESICRFRMPMLMVALLSKEQSL